jgi:hypothetical protein
MTVCGPFRIGLRRELNLCHGDNVRDEGWDVAIDSEPKSDRHAWSVAPTVP